MLQTILTPEIRQEIGIFQCGTVRTDQIPFHPQVRTLCEQNVCRNYGTTWACPPATGTPDDCKAECLRYSHILLFSSRYPLQDSFDFEGMEQGLRDFKKVCDRLDSFLKPLIPDYKILSNEGCGRCKICTYPSAPCRFPEKLHPSIEGYGILVSELAKKAGVNYINGQNTLTYFGGVLFFE